MDQQRFEICIDRIRCGDSEAAAVLLAEFQPQIRRMIRLRMVGSNLRRVHDSVDICQSVFANFFDRAASGQFEINTPEQLFALLATMARNKLTQRYRSETARRPKQGKSILYGGLLAELNGSCSHETPSQHIVLAELIERFQQRLSNEERELAELRRDGYTWDEISQQRGETPEALRKRLERAIARVNEELGLEG